jgi:O-antigen ligase
MFQSSSSHSSVSTQPGAGERGSRLADFRGVRRWLLVGITAGAFPIVATAAGLEMRYLVYGVLVTVLVSLLGYAIMFVGSLETLLWSVLVLSLQLELAFTPILVSGGKAAGPYGTMITPTLLCGLALIALWAGGRLWGNAERLRVDRGIVLASGGVLCAALLSFVNAAGRMLSFFGVFELLSLALTAVVANHACSERRNILTLRSVLFVALFVQSTLLILEQVLGVQISLAKGINTNYGWGSNEEGRFAGTFGAPSSAAIFLVVCLLFLFRRVSSKQPPARVTVLWGLFTLGFLALLLTRTRSSWIAFAIGCGGLGWQCYRDGTLSPRMARRLVVGGLLALLIAWPLVAMRLAEDHKGMADTRGNLVWIAVAMIKAHPFAGVGINTATNQVYTYAARAGLASGWVFIVHNQFLLVGAETGLPGLAAFLALTWVGIRAARRCMRSDDFFIRETGGVFFWSLIAMCWALNLDHVSGCMTYVLFWFLIGAACGLDALRQRESTLIENASGVLAGARAAA